MADNTTKNNVGFLTGNLEQFKALENKDPNNLYFLDNGQIYKGDTLMQSSPIVIDGLITNETEKEKGYLYKDSTKRVTFFDGEKDIEIIPSIGQENNENIPTVKDVADLIGKSQPSIIEKTTPNNGAFKTYEFYIGKSESKSGTLIGAVDIPKDFLVKSGVLLEFDTDALAAEEKENLKAGTYLKFIINSKDNDDTDSAIYIDVKKLVNIYKAKSVDTSNAPANPDFVKITISKNAATGEMEIGGEFLDQYLSLTKGGIVQQKTNFLQGADFSNPNDSEVQNVIIQEKAEEDTPVNGPWKKGILIKSKTNVDCASILISGGHIVAPQGEDITVNGQIIISAHNISLNAKNTLSGKTPSLNSNNTELATTEFVNSKIANAAAVWESIENSIPSEAAELEILNMFEQ